MLAENDQAYYAYIDSVAEDVKQKREIEQKAKAQTTLSQPRSNFTIPINPPVTKRQSQDEVIQEFWNEEFAEDKADQLSAESAFWDEEFADLDCYIPNMGVNR